MADHVANYDGPWHDRNTRTNEGALDKYLALDKVCHLERVRTRRGDAATRSEGDRRQGEHGVHDQASTSVVTAS